VCLFPYRHAGHCNGPYPPVGKAIRRYGALLLRAAQSAFVLGGRRGSVCVP